MRDQNWSFLVSSHKALFGHKKNALIDLSFLLLPFSPSSLLFLHSQVMHISLWHIILLPYDFCVLICKFINVPLYLVQISGFRYFHVLNLNCEKFKLYLQNTHINMLKTTRVYFRVLHDLTHIRLHYQTHNHRYTAR